MTRRQFVQSAALLATGAAASQSNLQLLRETAPFHDLPRDAWRHARKNGLVMIWPNPPAHPSSVAHIADREPGQPLVVMGQVYAPDGQTPAPGVTVYAYNTDAAGYYGAGHTDYPPRLHGWMLTDASGHFELHTIRPGTDPNMRDPAQIHFVLWGGGYPVQSADPLQFTGDPLISDVVRETAGAKGMFDTIQLVTRGADGAERCHFNIRLFAESNFY